MGPCGYIIDPSLVQQSQWFTLVGDVESLSLTTIGEDELVKLLIWGKCHGHGFQERAQSEQVASIIKKVLCCRHCNIFLQALIRVIVEARCFLGLMHSAQTIHVVNTLLHLYIYIYK